MTLDAGEGAARWLRVDEKQLDGWSTWNVRGEIDYYTANLFRRRVRVAAQRSGAGDIVLDMHDVAFMDASGVRELLRARRAGHELVIRRPSHQVELVLGLTHLDTVLTVEHAVR